MDQYVLYIDNGIGFTQFLSHLELYSFEEFAFERGTENTFMFIQVYHTDSTKVYNLKTTLSQYQNTCLLTAETV